MSGYRVKFSPLCQSCATADWTDGGRRQSVFLKRQLTGRVSAICQQTCHKTDRQTDDRNYYLMIAGGVYSTVFSSKNITFTQEGFKFENHIKRGKKKKTESIKMCRLAHCVLTEPVRTKKCCLQKGKCVFTMFSGCFLYL